MFIARGTVHRNLLLKRQNEQEEQNQQESDGSASESQVPGTDRRITQLPLGVNGEAPNTGRKGEPENSEEEEDENGLRLLSLEGLHGFRLLYMRGANGSRRMLNNNYFNSCVLLCISWASLSVGLQTYESLGTSIILDDMDLGVLAIFILECWLKIWAEGLKPWVFFAGKEMRWNNFDFVVIILSLPVWGSALGGGSLKILRMLRLLRIMKLVKRIPQLYMIIMGLIGGLKSIGYILLLLLLVFYLYAISGMYAWADNDQFHFRSVPIAMVTLFRMSTLENWSNIMNINYFSCDRFAGGYYTTNETEAKPFQFCNVTALYGENATDSDIQSTRTVNSIVAVIYFITFILISAFVMLSLFIGAITMSMTESMEQMKAAHEEAEKKERMLKAQKRAEEAAAREREKQRLMAEQAAAASAHGEDPAASKEKLSAAERRDRQKMREVLMQTWDDCDLTDILSQNQGDNQSWKGRYLMVAARCAKIVEHPSFTGFITLVICMAGLMVGLQTSIEVEDAIGGVLAVIDSTILAVFTTEVVLKLVAEGVEPWMYFRSGWNTFDFIIVVGSFTRGKGGMLTMLRLLRLLRVLKLVRAFPQLQVIVSALMKGVGSIGYIGLILLLCFYVFGIIGNLLFAQNDPFHFQYLHYAMVSLFQCATMDGWSDVLYINYYGCDAYGYDDYEAQGYKCVNKPAGFLAVFYFSTFIVLGAMVLITLFIGVVTTSMEEATQEMEAEKAMLRRIEDLRIRKNVEQAVVSSYMQVFRMLDLDGSGSVEEAELRIGLAAIGKYPSYDELKEMMDVVDEDGSGQIDIVEFVEFMIHVREKSTNQRKAADEAAASAAAAPPAEAPGSAAVVVRPHPIVEEGDEHESEIHDTDSHDRITRMSHADGMDEVTGPTREPDDDHTHSITDHSINGDSTESLNAPLMRRTTASDGKLLNFHTPILDGTALPSPYTSDLDHTMLIKEDSEAQLLVDKPNSSEHPVNLAVGSPLTSPRVSRSSNKYKIVPSG
ncbi:hypothetical protein Poli38472_003880 [Pythium oligandrum]|uniref:EF-hand domain-containing protein n=1 Tax=Pythium oligandrum TaxID=41045 RepID=A0A8K1CMN3_PYTOL|nr:hypothetical protein Poli38472_003880 [Pythium oligandrum]|eukprot:TMW66115.1 hypothetical protein Poli38472_003880 [Pythium oligandrum]